MTTGILFSFSRLLYSLGTQCALWQVFIVFLCALAALRKTFLAPERTLEMLQEALCIHEADQS
jgi:hypothetical protein